MESLMKEYCYAGSYSRLSKDDGDKAESDSIKNQKELIRNFQKSHPEIEIIEEYSDDGYSGINFERPDFKRMMDDVKAQRINCIIVKDLSRFGRNYIETGKYMEKIFPFLNVRFIAINDNYDSARKQNQSDYIVLPFKNLVNDIYCRDISIKVRSNLNAKRRKGDYVGAFAPYGYKKSESNRNQLVIDEPAAKVVKRIFALKINGRSNGSIADILNAEGVFSPYEYKRRTPQGKNYKPGFYVKSNPRWSTTTVLRILENEVYLGHLIQGKNVRPNYKIKKQVEVDSNEWIRVENTHNAIISRSDFELVQKLLLIDTRTSPGQSQIYLFSGILCCAECGETLIRRVVSSKNEKYTYYGCYTKERKMKCKGISIRESVLEKVVLEAIQKHVELMIEMSKLLQYADEIPLYQNEVKAINDQIQSINNEITRYRSIKASLYSDFHKGIINQDEYIDLKNIYDKKEKDFNQNILTLTDKKERFSEGRSDSRQWLNLFKKFLNIPKLDRRILFTLISKIYISSNKKINICFTYQDEFNKRYLHIKE